METKKIVQGVFGFLFLVALFCGIVYLIPWLFMALWNDMTPHFGIDIQFTWWETVKLFFLVGFIRWWLTSDVKKDVKKIKLEIKHKLNL